MDPKHLAQLRIHDACKGLLPDEIATISKHIEVVQTKTGEQIHAAGQALNYIYIVVQGRLKLTFTTPDKTTRTIRYISAGDQFGALTLVSDEEIPVDVFVDEAAILYRMSRELAIELTDRFPRFRRNLWQKIGFGVRDALFGKRRKRLVSKIVTFANVDNRSRELVTCIASRLKQAGEQIGVVGTDHFRSTAGDDTLFQSLIDQEDGDYLDENEINATVEQWSGVNRILLITDPSISTETLARILELSDQVFYFAEPKKSQPVIDELGTLIRHTPSWRRKTHLIWALGADEQVSPLVPELADLVFRDFKIQIPNQRRDNRFFVQGIDRVVHYLRGVSIGLALSGGAAHGMTHLGVLKALEEAGITVDKMSGTSAGVLTGVVYAAGMEPDWAAERFTHDLEPGSIYKKLPKGDGFYMLKQYRSKAWDGMLRKYLHDWRLEQLPVPISTVTTDLISAESVARTSGDAVDCILESINLPILSPPICRDGMMLVDGGILNNLPADVLVNHGCNFVIGVDVAAVIEHQVGKYTAETPDDQMKPPGAVATLLRSLSVQAHNMSAVGASPADVIIAPDVSTIDAASFTRTPEMADIGYKTTLQSLPEIKEILCNLDNDLFCGVDQISQTASAESGKAAVS